MAKKIYTVEKEIYGKKYTAQFNGISAALDAQDSFYIDDSANVSTKKMSDYMLKHVIVDPKGLTPDDFNTMDELTEVVKWANEVMNGNFCPEEDKSTTK